MFVHPLLLGAGKRLFGDLPVPRALSLTSVGTTSKGTVAVIYRLDSQPVQGMVGGVPSVSE